MRVSRPLPVCNSARVPDNRRRAKKRRRKTGSLWSPTVSKHARGGGGGRGEGIRLTTACSVLDAGSSGHHSQPFADVAGIWTCRWGHARRKRCAAGGGNGGSAGSVEDLEGTAERITLLASDAISETPTGCGRGSEQPIPRRPARETDGVEPAGTGCHLFVFPTSDHSAEGSPAVFRTDASRVLESP